MLELKNITKVYNPGPVSYTHLANILVVYAIAHPFPLNTHFGTLAVDLGCFPFDDGSYNSPSDSTASSVRYSQFDRVLSLIHISIMNLHAGIEHPFYLGNENVGDPEITD